MTARKLWSQMSTHPFLNRSEWYSSLIYMRLGDGLPVKAWLQQDRRSISPRIEASRRRRQAYLPNHHHGSQEVCESIQVVKIMDRQQSRHLQGISAEHAAVCQPSNLQ